MALIRCPECQRSISDKASSCPHCGFPLSSSKGSGSVYSRGYGYEYKSSRTLFGLPLIHIVYGPGPNGSLKPARGFIAIGNIAFGVVALGGFSAGIISIGGISLGLISLGGLALGILGGLGGVATGYVAFGGIAIGVYAVGGLAVGIHTLYNSPELREFLKSLAGRG
jgi:hypothetical protein